MGIDIPSFRISFPASDTTGPHMGRETN
ncbi:hypothetical protein IL54_4372 [Sphingobium sp. ba1]|nr:hypothetical protein IL54_4372 [Sphingobium sp. ba1]